VFTPVEKTILVLEVCFAAAILAGLGVRRRLYSAVFFDLYLATILVFDLLLLLWPERYFTWDFWLFKEIVQSSSKVLLSIELMARLFWRLPRARWAASIGLVGILAGTVIAVLGVSGGDAEDLSKAMMPRIFYGTAIMFALVLTLALSYGTSLIPVHKAILLGFTPYLLTFTVLVQLLELGTGVRLPMSYANNLAFFGLLAYWTRAVWQSGEDLEIQPV
jgi:hypothetical protein